MKNLLLFDTLRGEHSTGLLSVFKNKKKKTFYSLLKAVGTPDKMYDKYPKYFKKGVYDTSDNPFLLMGHNRFATQGKIDEEGAHPFVFDNLIGAHNGTVRQWSLRDFHGANDFDIDSQIIYSELSHSGDIKKVWGELDGAASLTWYNRKNNTMNFIRNDERPMKICFTIDRRTMFWASEEWMLVVALNKAGIKHTDIFSTDEDIHYEFNVEGDKITSKEEEYEPRKPVYYNYYNNGYQRNIWPTNIIPSMKTGGDAVRIKLLKSKVVDNLKVYLAEFHFVESPDVKFPIEVKYQYVSNPNNIIGNKIEAALKKGNKYYYTRFNHVYHMEGTDRIWYDNIYLDDVQTESGLEDKETKKKPKEVVKKSTVIDKTIEKLWKTPFNEVLWKDKFEDTYHVCENCLTNIYWEDRTTIKVISKDACLCGECSDLPYLSHYMT